ncbi:ABC transporter permease [Patulibacter brassicae]|uniref:ABC transporter permease n=1 Tax=Patulibacter brassicae TaxID=1705717 RepID=A0ABU4VMB3_9ACTN|nr:ABC transporter permease [Patulibacter brassicae]MDX8152977.1 ABC transporter permease [Patulibacter brassicae]
MSNVDATRPPRPAPPRAADAVASSTAFGWLRTAGGMGWLFLVAAREALTPPRGYWRAAVVEMSLTVQRCVLPLAVVATVFVIGFGFFVLGGITEVLGASDREGGAVIVGLMREMAIWTTGMVFAGVAGSAMAADIGSRKAREELDALDVLGVDKIRMLVVPKVVAGALICPVLGMLCVLFLELANAVLAPGQFGYSREVLFASTRGSLTALDIYGALIRFVIIGAMVAVVASYKGLTASGGTEGVGRAVNQTIVVSFALIWGFDAFFNLAYLSLFPDAQVSFKG